MCNCISCAPSQVPFSFEFFCDLKKWIYSYQSRSKSYVRNPKRGMDLSPVEDQHRTSLQGRLILLIVCLIAKLHGLMVMIRKRLQPSPKPLRTKDPSKPKKRRNCRRTESPRRRHRVSIIAFKVASLWFILLVRCVSVRMTLMFQSAVYAPRLYFHVLGRFVKCLST